MSSKPAVVERAACYELRLVQTGHVYPEPLGLVGPKCWYGMLASRYGSLAQEHFGALYLDGRMRLLGHALLAIGTTERVEVDRLLVLKPAIELLAHGIVVFHNHPPALGQQLEASESDVVFTKALGEGAAAIGSRLLDHVIVSGNAWVSIGADAGLRRSRGLAPVQGDQGVAG